MAFDGQWHSVLNGNARELHNLLVDTTASPPVIKRDTATGVNLEHNINGNNVVFVEAAGALTHIYSGQLIVDAVSGAQRIGVIKGRRVTLSGLTGGATTAPTLVASDDWTATRPPGT